MTQFYNKYKDLFLPQYSPPLYAKSYLKPYIGEMKNRAQSLNYMANNKSKNRTSKFLPADRFQSQILPEISRLNEQNSKHRVYTEIKPLEYFPTTQPYNKNNKLKPLRIQDHFDKKVQKYSQVRNLDEKGKWEREKLPKYRNYSNAMENPQDMNTLPLQSQIKEFPKRAKNERNQNIFTNTSPIHQRYIYDPKYFHKQIISPKQHDRCKTQSSSIAQCPKKVIRMDETRKDYGYPQVNYGLIFDQYQRNNQFKFIDKKLKDIKWLQKYYPRGNLNSYKEALVRRNKGKKNMEARRNKLKEILLDEEEEYEKYRSII